jgi:hypothetical protein
METVGLCFSEKLVYTYEFTWGHKPEEQHRLLHYHDSLKFLMCIDWQEIVWKNIVLRNLFLLLVSSVYGQLRRRISLVKLIVAQLLNKLFEFCGTPS